MTKRKNPEDKLPPGRPSDYSQEKVDKLCEYLSHGMSLRRACEQPDMPSTTTVFAWFRQFPSFLAQYTVAKQEAADSLVDEMLDIADDGRNDFMEIADPDNPGYRANGEHINRSRLRVETRKWIAAKLKPKKYGERQAIEHTGEDGGPIKTESVLDVSKLSTEVLAEIMKASDATKRD